MLKIHLYTLTWNSEKTITQFLQWYSFADKVTVYDNLSEDATTSVIKEIRPDAEIIPFDTGGYIDNVKFLQIKNHCWKEDRDCDYAIVCDDDEVVFDPYNQGIVSYLSIMKERGITLVPTTGYDLFFNSFNPEFMKYVHYGAPNSAYGKYCIFDPHRLLEINYNLGCHDCFPMGEIKLTPTRLALLHARYHGFSWWKGRNDAYAKRVNHHIVGASFYEDQARRILTEENYKKEFEQNKMDIRPLLNLKGKLKK